MSLFVRNPRGIPGRNSRGIPSRAGSTRDRRFERGQQELREASKRHEGMTDDFDSLIELINELLGQGGPLDVRPINLAQAQAMVEEQLGEDQVVFVRGYREESSGQYISYEVAAPGAPALALPDAYDFVVARAGSRNRGRPTQTCFAVPGGGGVRFTPLLPAVGTALAGRTPQPTTLQDLIAQAERDRCDPGKLSRDIREGRAIDDPRTPERQLRESKDVTDATNADGFMYA
jgi:hypothetical protein